MAAEYPALKFRVLQRHWLYFSAQDATLLSTHSTQRAAAQHYAGFLFAECKKEGCMAKCVICRAETSLFDGETPICIDCDALLESKAAEEREKLQKLKAAVQQVKFSRKN